MDGDTDKVEGLLKTSTVEHWCRAGLALLLMCLSSGSLHAEGFRAFAPTQHRNGDRPVEGISGRFEAAHLDLGVIEPGQLDSALEPYNQLYSRFSSDKPPTLVIYFSPDRTPEEQQKAKDDAVRKFEAWSEKHLGTKITPQLEWHFLDKAVLDPKEQAKELDKAVDEAANKSRIPGFSALFRRRGHEAVAKALTAIDAERKYGMKKNFWQRLAHPSYNRKALDPYVYLTGAVTGGVRGFDMFKGGLRVPGLNEVAVLLIDPMISIVYNKFIEKINDVFDRHEIPLVRGMMGKDSPILKRIAPRLNELYKEKTEQLAKVYQATSGMTPVERARDRAVRVGKNLFWNFWTINMARSAAMTYLLSPEALTKELFVGWMGQNGGDTIAVTSLLDGTEQLRQKGHITGSGKRAIIWRNNIPDRVGAVMTAIPGMFWPGMGIIAGGSWSLTAYEALRAARAEARTDRFVLVDEDVLANTTDIHDTEAGTEHPIKAHDRPQEEVIAEVGALGKVGEQTPKPDASAAAPKRGVAERVRCAFASLMGGGGESAQP